MPIAYTGAATATAAAYYHGGSSTAYALLAQSFTAWSWCP